MLGAGVTPATVSMAPTAQVIVLPGAGRALEETEPQVDSDEGQS